MSTSLDHLRQFPFPCEFCKDAFASAELLRAHQRSICGPAFVSGVIESVYEARRALKEHDRAKVFHQFPPGSPSEHAFAEGCHFAAVRLLAGAEFALQVRGESVPAQAKEGEQN